MQKLLITGGTGLVGKRFCELYSKTFDLHVLSRNTNQPNTPKIQFHHWDIDKNIFDIGKLSPDVILTLHGEGIAAKRWTKERKDVLIKSRVNPLQFLNHKLIENNIKINTLIGISAIGYYGNRPNEILTEDSVGGEGFLSLCCKQWEDAYIPLKTLAERQVLLRLGTVLSNKGGALPKMLMTKSIGIFPYFGNGSQMMSWIHIDDVCKIIAEAIVNPIYEGNFNAVSPAPMTNKRFTSTVKNIYSKNGFTVPVSSALLKLSMGEMSTLLFDDNAVKPKRLEQLRFNFNFKNLEEGLLDLKSFI